MAAQPVSANIDAASSIVRISPLATTGMRSTASTTARMPSRLTRPLKPCSRVRPWTITPATPTCSNARARSGAVSDSSSQPSRIFTVTGIFTAATTAATRSTARSIWHIRAEPPPPLTTFRTGQPMLISTAGTPRASTQRAACSISAVTAP